MASRLVHRWLTQGEINEERSRMRENPGQRSLLVQRGVEETNPSGAARDVYRVSRPLNSLSRRPETHELLTHQGVYVDPGYVFGFRAGPRDEFGRRTLKIEVSDMDDSWTHAEYAGKTNATDSEVYHTCRAWKKLHRPYSVRRANCQHGAEEVADCLTEGKSVLRPAPIRRWPSIIRDNIETEGITNTIVKAKKTGRYMSRGVSSPQRAVEEAFRDNYPRN